jgi:hypothetical protein
MAFASKRDAWLMIVLAASAIMMFVGLAASISTPAPVAEKVGFVLLMLAAAGFVGWIVLATDYSISQTHLIARSGPFVWRVPLAEIIEVYPTRNPLSAPALSLDRLGVRQRGRGMVLMISPADRIGFLAELTSKEPSLRRDGDGLKRRS